MLIATPVSFCCGLKIVDRSVRPTITVRAATKTRTSHADNSAREIIEILDSDTEDEAPVISKAALGLADGRKDGAEKCDSSIDVVKDEAKDQVRTSNSIPSLF